MVTTIKNNMFHDKRKETTMSFSKNAQTVSEEVARTLAQVPEDDVDAAIALINGANRIFLNALGRAKFAGQSFVMRLMHMGYETYVIGETNTPNFDEGDLLIVCSGSGETGQFVANANKAHSLGGKVLLFTATRNSTLSDIAEATVCYQAPSKEHGTGAVASVQPMASLFEQSILMGGDAIVLTLMERSDKDNDEMFSRHTNIE